MDPKTGLTKGFQITICYETNFKNISRYEAQGPFMEKLCQIKIPLGKTYSNSLGIDLNLIIKNNVVLAWHTSSTQYMID